MCLTDRADIWMHFVNKEHAPAYARNASQCAVYLLETAITERFKLKMTNCGEYCYLRKIYTAKIEMVK